MSDHSRSRNTDRKFCWPVLGALFRSTSWQRNESELVILVTAYLVQPSYMSQLSTPSDTYTPPNDYELFFLGRVAGKPDEPAQYSQPSSAALQQLIKAAPNGGIAADYGHIIQ